MRGNFIFFPFLVIFYPISQIKFDKPDNKIIFLIFWLPHNDLSFFQPVYRNKILRSKVFKKHVFEIGYDSEFVFLPIKNLKFELFHLKQKLLFSVEYAPSVWFADYGRKINILECCPACFRVREPRLNGEQI